MLPFWWSVWLLPAITAMGQKKFFMQLFADSGVSINCPSGNKVYIHPISGDLQQCSQQLGQYNESSCPGGTVCERFPILVPGFQDYCCFTDEEDDNDEEILKKTTRIPDDLHPFTQKPDRPKKAKGKVIDAVIEKPDKSEPEDEEEDLEWEFETTTRRTKKTRGRYTTTTTTEEPTTTTTKKPVASRRLPRCNNPDDSPLIDFGNRLRDCYFQQCYPGFRCEFNKEIRRFICCGQAREVAPPAGLPPIPAPKPLIPRPFRPRPFGMLNDGDDEYPNGCPWNNGNGCSQSSQNKWNSGNKCPLNQGPGGPGCPRGNGNGQKGLPPAKPAPPSTSGSSKWSECKGGGASGAGCGWKGSGENSGRLQPIPLPPALPAPPRGPPEPKPLTESHSQRKPWSIHQSKGSNWPPKDNHWQGLENRSLQRKLIKPNVDYDYDNGRPGSRRWQENGSGILSEPFQGGYGSGSKRIPSSSEPQCATGREYQILGKAPKCTPPGSDSCPLSHPRCIPSPGLGHNVCCL